MKHLFYILVGVFLLLSLGVRAQETRKKELLRELVKSPQDTTRLTILYELSVATMRKKKVNLNCYCKKQKRLVA